MFICLAGFEINGSTAYPAELNRTCRRYLLSRDKGHLTAIAEGGFIRPE
jgi:hypothetical protein